MAALDAPLLEKRIRFGKVKIISVLLLATCFTAHMYYVCMEFLRYPLNYSIVMDKTEAPFPDVTLCPDSPFNQLKVAQFHFGNRTFRQMNESVFHLWKEALSNPSGVLHDLNHDKPVLADPHHWNWLSLLPFAQRNHLLHDWHEVVLRARVNGVNVALRNSSLLPQKPLGDALPCWTFSMAGYEADTLSLEIFTPRNATEPHAMTSSSLAMKTDGFVAVLHPRGTLASFMGGVQDVQRMYKTILSFLVEMNENVGPPVGNCTASEEEERVVFQWENYLNTRIYDATSCAVKVFQEHLAKECGCYDEQHPIPASLWVSNGSSIPRLRYRGCREVDLMEMFATPQSLTAGWNETLKRATCFLKVLVKTGGAQDYGSNMCRPTCVFVAYKTRSVFMDWEDAQQLARFDLREFAKKISENNSRDYPTLAQFARVDSYNETSPNGLMALYMCESWYGRQPNALLCLLWHRTDVANLVVTRATRYQFESRQKRADEWLSLLDQVGGVVGLWIGLSLVELITAAFSVAKTLLLIAIRMYGGESAGDTS